MKYAFESIIEKVQSIHTQQANLREDTVQIKNLKKNIDYKYLLIRYVTAFLRFPKDAYKKKVVIITPFLDPRL